MKVKICGTTNLEDALLAVEAGADFVGFIFYPPSKRSIEVTTAKKIVSSLRNRQDCPLLVGVFVNETAAQIAAVLESCQLDLAQLHGDEVPAMIGDENSPIYGRGYKVLRPTSQAEAEADAEWYLPPQPFPGQPSLMIDTYHPTLRGGTGETTDWTTSAHLAATYPGLMLAGGLTPDNVAEAVRQVRPYAVDVASGVEATPGKKDPALVHTFIKYAKAIN